MLTGHGTGRSDHSENETTDPSRPFPDDSDARISAIAARQHGVVTRAQLLAAGVTRHVLEHRLARGRFVAIYRGVYRLGPVTSVREREMAAVLACGLDAMLSYRSASVVWEIIYLRDAGPRIDVSIVGGCRAPGPDVCVHRVTSMHADEITRRDALPITTPARTLLDLGCVVELRVLERAVALAGRKDMVDQAGLLELLSRHPRGRGTRALRTVLGFGGALPSLTRSEAEERFLALLRTARVREPEVNVLVRGFEVDCLWRAQRLVVEIDGFAFHAGREAFERDRRRDAALTAAGYRVMRVTWRQVTREREALAVTVAEALMRAGPA